MPIGPQPIEFNAHRVFSLPYLISLMKGLYKIERFAYVDDQGDLFLNVEVDTEPASRSFGCHYGCGIFRLVKL